MREGASRSRSDPHDPPHPSDPHHPFPDGSPAERVAARREHPRWSHAYRNHCDWLL